MKLPDPQEFVDRLGARIIYIQGAHMPHKDTLGFYSPDADAVFTRPREEWIARDRVDVYWQTLFHELIHWTGHPSRLNRPTTGGSIDHAIEELTAELGSGVLDVKFGITPVWQIIYGNCMHALEGFSSEITTRCLGIAEQQIRCAIQYMEEKVNGTYSLATASIAA